MKAQNYDHLTATWIERIHATYLLADSTMLADGRAWYPAMTTLMKRHSRESGLSVMQCAAIYAANSINTPWSRNVSLAAGVIADHIRGLAPYTSTTRTLGVIIRKVERIIAGDDIDSTLSNDSNNRKIKSFCRNLAGDYDAVTVDRWAMRIAYGRTDGGYVPTGAEYEAIASAYRKVATMVGETPATVQAITWCVIRGTGA